MTNKRRSGILMHPTSFAGSAGIGTLGKSAYQFIDWLAAANQQLWQILPLGPTGYGDSPYASFSTFAGNPLLIDLEQCITAGLLSADDVNLPDYIKTDGIVDFGAVVYWKLPLLNKAADSFMKKATAEQQKLYEQFLAEQSDWINDYAIFMDIKQFYDEKAQSEHKKGCRWNNYWPKDLALHDVAAIEKWTKEHTSTIERQKIIQFFFFTQWNKLKTYAVKQNISIIGDIPIFVAADSSDVWANQHLFQLDQNGTPTAVAGVPPDYFSETGQLWGNPLYNWDAMKKDNYRWWIRRIQSMRSLVDIIRIDHFRGFESYWSIPADEKTAVNGCWIKGPGKDLFDAIYAKLGPVPIIAEDLGVITSDVATLRDSCALPGMKVLQFAFSTHEAKEHGMTNYFLPHMLSTQKCVMYTGTHDNDTLCGWIASLDAEERNLVCRYTGTSENACDTVLADALIRVAIASVADTVIIPMQDVLHLGSESRMNTPSTTGTNWTWRMNVATANTINAETKSPDLGTNTARLKEFAFLYARNQSDIQ